MDSTPMITNDAIVLGILLTILAAIFVTSASDKPFWKKFYSFVPTLLLAYFLPSVLSSLGVISGDESNLYFVSSRFLLPASLVLLTLSIDFKAVLSLGPKALIMFFTATIGILLGGPLAVLLFSYIDPSIVGGQGPEAVWRGLTTVAGSWIGGGANQTAMKEVFEVGDEVFSAMVAVDVLVGNLWLAVLLICAGRSKAIDRWNGADTSAIENLRQRVEDYQAQVSKIPSLKDSIVVLAVGFGATAIAHWGAGGIAPWIKANFPGLERLSLTSNFFWIVVIATTLGMIAATTRLRKLEGVGASRVGSVFIWILVASIGMKMNLRAVVDQWQLFLVGLVWISFHALLLFVVARMIKAPLFFAAVGSQANVGGAASAPIVASAFHPALAPVGVLLAVLGYAVGTYGAWVCGQLMRMAAPIT